MKPEDVQKLRQRITMNVHFLSAIKGFRDSEAIHTTKQVVISIHDEHTSRREREILDWLTATDYAPQQRDHLSRRYTGTNQWLLDSDEYKSWVSGQNQTLICPGMPGAGKTIMASVVVDDLLHRHQDGSDVGIAYVYCNFKDQERQNHYDMLSSITKQLAQSRSPIPSSLKELYDTHQRKKTSRTLEETITLLQAVASSHHRVFIVIDALDECGSKSRQALMTEVTWLQKRHPTNVLATPREISEIIQSVNFKCASTLRYQASDVDVSRYISSRIPVMQNFVQRRPDIQKEIQEGVLCRINGMFLLAKLLIDSLSCKTTPKAVRKALAAASVEEDTYAYFYDEALNRIRLQPPEHVQLAHQALSWLVSAKRPLEMNELQHALAVEEDEPDMDEDNIPSAEVIISVCAGLVTLDGQGGVVRLVHQTTQEFFNNRCQDLFPNADAEITNTCVRYLCLSQVRKQIRNRTRDIPPWRKPLYFEALAFKDSRKSKVPFFEYATLYWGHHAGSCETVPSNIVQILKSREMLQGLALISNDLNGEDIPPTGAHLAAFFGLLQVFKNHLLPAEDETFVDGMGQSILSWAAHRGHSDLIEHILEDDTLRMKKHHYRDHVEPFRLALLKAIKSSHVDAARKLIQFGSNEDLDFESTDGPSLLHLCIAQGEVTMIRMLLERSQYRLVDTQKLTSISGVKVEKMDRHHGTPLVFAALKGLDEVVKLLLDHGANIEALDKAGRSPLLRAFQSGHAPTVEVLVQNGAKLLGRYAEILALWPENNHYLVVESLVNGGADIESRNMRGMTLLACAAEAGHTAMLVKLLDHKANINSRDNVRRTPLWHALINKHDSTFEMLLKKGAAVEAVDRFGDTPLFFVAKNGLISMLSLLITLGAQLNARNKKTGRTPLWYAITDECTSALEVLIYHNAMIEATDRSGRTSLSFAAEMNNLPALEILLRHGAVVDASDQGHRTPLSYAAAAGSVLCLMTLIGNGADINCRNAENMTPVMLAAEAGRVSALEKLLELGVDLAVRDKFGRTAFSIAAGAGRNSILSTDDLKKKYKNGNHKRIWGPPPSRCTAILRNNSAHQQLRDAPDHQGRTPLWWAITSGSTHVLKQLSEVVDEVEVVDKQGKPPLMGAWVYKQHEETVELLLEHVSQFGSDGDRLVSHEGMSERAINYVRSFLEFNEIDTNRDFSGELRDVWLNIKPGDPIPQRTSDEPSSDSCHEFLFGSSYDLSLSSVGGKTRTSSVSEVDGIDWVDNLFNWEDVLVDELAMIDGLERWG